MAVGDPSAVHALQKVQELAEWFGDAGKQVQMVSGDERVARADLYLEGHRYIISVVSPQAVTDDPSGGF